MVVGIGIDVASVDRMARALARFGHRFAERILTDAELAEVCRRRPLSPAALARRFAVKEAFSKALGAPRDVFWHDLEVPHDDRGRPRLRLLGAAEAHARRLAVRRFHLSITEDAGIAAAFVILECA